MPYDIPGLVGKHQCLGCRMELFFKIVSIAVFYIVYT